MKKIKSGTKNNYISQCQQRAPALHIEQTNKQTNWFCQPVKLYTTFAALIKPSKIYSSTYIPKY